MAFEFPKATERTFVFGRTGSGKTRFAAFLFSQSQFRKRPHVIIDFKGEALFERIDRCEEISMKAAPKYNGLYIIRPTPHQSADVEAFLWSVWKRENIGVYIDEGYMIDARSPALNAILTQGRSKRVSVLALTQRPVWCSRFLLSEADHFAGFALNDLEDWKRVAGFTPRNSVWDYRRPLAAFHSRWYSVKTDFSAIVKPVPGDDEILERFDAGLSRLSRAV